MLSDRQESLLATEREVTAELHRLAREEEYLLLKVRQAREQVRYYEGPFGSCATTGAGTGTSRNSSAGWARTVARP